MRIWRFCLAAVLLAAVAMAGWPASAESPLRRTPAAELPALVRDLPLIVSPAPPGRGPLVVWISGDGGWGEMERDVGRILGEAGAPLVGVNSLRYFWSERRPAEVAQAIDRIVRAFAPKFGRTQFVLVGFSFGADMTPLVIDRLSADVRAQLARAVILSPAVRAAYEVGPATWLGIGDKDEVGPAILSLRGVELICVRGHRDPNAACPAGSAPGYSIVDLPGGHTLEGDWPRIAQMVLDPPTAALVRLPDETRLAGAAHDLRETKVSAPTHLAGSARLSGM